MSSSMIIATIALQGAAVGISGEIAIRSIFGKRDRIISIRIGKLMMGLFMAIKSVLFLAFHASLRQKCYLVARFADLFFQLSMTAGTHVLVTRVQSIVPIDWKKRMSVLHIFLTVLRLAIGIVDVALTNIHYYPDGECQYMDQRFWGPVYTLYDTFLDVYVTLAISFILIKHIHALNLDRMKTNRSLYVSVICHNVIRTVCLTVVNLTSAIFIISQDQTTLIMLLWPIINIAFVILVGYDSDVTRTIRKLRANNWHTENTTAPNTIDIGAVPSIRILNTKSTLSRSHSDLNRQSKHGDEEEEGSYNLGTLRIELPRSNRSTYTANIKDEENQQEHYPKSTAHSSTAVTSASTSYDTSNTRVEDF